MDLWIMMYEEIPLMVFPSKGKAMQFKPNVNWVEHSDGAYEKYSMKHMIYRIRYSE